MRHQIAFRQYNPRNPHKYGLLLNSIDDSRFAFTYKAAPYAGKPENYNGPDYICATEDYVKYLLKEFEKDTSLKGRNILTECLYTSIPLAKWLLDCDIATVRIPSRVRISIPDELKDTKRRQNFSVTCHIESKEKKSIYRTTYSVKTKSTGHKNVLMLLTMRPIRGITKYDGKSTPAIMRFYDFTKGGTNIVDQLNDYYDYSCRAGTNRWDLVSFFLHFDTVRVNSKTVWCLKNLLDIKKTNTFKYSCNLTSQLTKPFIESCQINGLGTAVIHKMEKVLDRSLHEERPPGGIGKRYPLLGEINRRCKNARLEQQKQ